MSVRAYLTKRNVLWIDDDLNVYKTFEPNKGLKKYTNTDYIYVFNLWRQNRFYQVLTDYLYFDGLDDNSNGIIEINRDSFYEMYNDCKNYFNNVNDVKSLEILKNYFDEDIDIDIATLECF